MLKLLPQEVFSSLLISFIETDLPCCVSLGMCALLSLKPDFPWSHPCRRACPPPYHNSSLLRNFRWGLGGRRGRWWGGQTWTRASLWHSSPLVPFPQSYWPTSALSTLRYIDPAWSTGSQQDQNITHFSGPHSQKASIWHTFQSLLGKRHGFMTVRWVLCWLMYLQHRCVGILFTPKANEGISLFTCMESKKKTS